MITVPCHSGWLASLPLMSCKVLHGLNHFNFHVCLRKEEFPTYKGILALVR